ncbi:DUF177 domain-containing protein [Chloroflexota bacterium]
MQLNTAQLLKEAIGASRSYDINDGLSFTEEEIEKCHVQGNIKLVRTDKGILVKGNLEGQSHLMCSRCLNYFEYPLKFKIEEEYFPSIHVSRGISLPLPEDSTVFMIDEHHVIDLSEAVRQYALLDIPMKPLCRTDCGGLCPDCGANLNLGACQCNPRVQDSLQCNSVRRES